MSDLDFGQQPDTVRNIDLSIGTVQVAAAKVPTRADLADLFSDAFAHNHELEIQAIDTSRSNEGVLLMTGQDAETGQFFRCRMVFDGVWMVQG